MKVEEVPLEGRRTMELILHVRFEGKSFDIPMTTLDLGSGSGDSQVKVSLANYLDVAESRFRNYVVERHDNGNFTLRPEAVFG